MGIPIIPAQASGVPSALAHYEPRGGFSVGDGAYLRVAVRYFVVENGVDLAVVEAIEKNGKPCTCEGARDVYYVPVKHLVAGKIVAEEIGSWQ